MGLPAFAVEAETSAEDDLDAALAALWGYLGPEDTAGFIAERPALSFLVEREDDEP
jgi:hypothetical protein